MAAAIPLLILLAVFWKPALRDHKTLVSADSIIDGVSMVNLQVHAFRHFGRLLWADGVYGGHPLFAEGQGAFANPLNMVTGWLIAPVTGPIAAMNLFHLLAMLLAGVGVMALCRSLGSSRWAAGFAAIAVVFSPIWLRAQLNMTISGALVWVPWVFWAMDRWQKRADYGSAMLLGTAVALLIVSGYPQAFHGAVMYMAVGLVAIPFQPAVRREWLAEWKRRLATGFLAIALCVGLSAVQWLPLLELTGLSHRSGGISLVFNQPSIAYFRGFLFSREVAQASFFYVPGSGSLLVTIVASLALVQKLPPRVQAHILPTIFLIQMGCERASPIFRVLYDHRLLPGLTYFRTVHLYINIGLIGVAVLAAFTIDAIANWVASDTRRQSWSFAGNRIRIAAASAIVAFWIWLAVDLRMPEVRPVHFVVLALAVVTIGLLMLLKRGPLIRMAMVVLLCAECLNLRMHSLRFFDPASIDKPASIVAIQGVKDWNDYRLLDYSSAASFVLTDSRLPEFPHALRRMMEAGGAMTNTLWGLGSIDGALALPTHHQTEAEKLMRADLAGQTANPAGSRLIDFLSVRYIAADQAMATPSLRPLWEDGEYSIHILENTAALPRFQLYARHVAVGSIEEAVAAIQALKTPTLVIENPPSAPQPEPADDVTPGAPAGGFEMLKAISTEYRADITADRPLWFFVADANYPGWHATLDGRPAPLFTAQLLGKAVAIPPGRHRLEITFVSFTFIAGLVISALSLFTVLFAVWASRRRPGQVLGQGRPTFPRPAEST
jgi:hypothetical protein